MRYLALLLLATGCGRLDFDERVIDARPADAPPPLCATSYTLQPVGLTSRYRIVTTGAEWLGAEATCEADGAHLVVIESDPENTFVANNTAFVGVATTSAWIGGGDAVHEGTYQWVTGAPLTYTNFETGEPNDFGGDEDCFQIYGGGLWNDTSCHDGPHQYVCECDLTPASSPATYCDTSTAANCGECGHACGATQTCQTQVCSP